MAIDYHRILNISFSSEGSVFPAELRTHCKAAAWRRRGCSCEPRVFDKPDPWSKLRESSYETSERRKVRVPDLLAASDKLTEIVTDSSGGTRILIGSGGSDSTNFLLICSEARFMVLQLSVIFGVCLFLLIISCFRTFLALIVCFCTSFTVHHHNTFLSSWKHLPTGIE